MRKILLYIICLLWLPSVALAEQTLSAEQRQRVASTVKTYFERLARYAAEPMGAEAGQISFDISEMFENRLDAPVYNDLVALKDKTGIDASCTISDYLLSFGLLSEKYGYKFRITYDSMECHPLVEPSNDNAMNALVYVRKYIEGGGVSETLTNVIRYNLITDKLSYIEKSSFTTSDEDINFLLENHYGYSTAKLNEMAARCFQEKKYKQAYQLYEQAAIRNDMDAQYALANMLWKRQGCEEYGLFATINMTKFWLKKVYYRYNGAISSYDLTLQVMIGNGVFFRVKEMMDIVFQDGPVSSLHSETYPFNFGLMRYEMPNKQLYGFINQKGEMIIPAIYSFASAFSDGLALVNRNGKYGYINTKEEVLIPFIYNRGSDFINGTASVSLIDTINGNIHERYFIINKKGQQISENFDFIDCRNRKDEMLIIARRGNKYGFINGFGQIKIPFIYDYYKKSCSSIVSDNFVSICQKDKWGFIDISSSEGRIFIQPQYENVGAFSYGRVWVDDGMNISFMDENGEKVCGGFKECTDFNSLGLASVKYEKNSNKGYLINKRGKILYSYNMRNGWKMYNIRRVK